MKEEAFTMTRSEAEYCNMICRLAAPAAKGSDAGRKLDGLFLRLQAELTKPAVTLISLTAEEKNQTVLAVMIYELLIREKYDVLKEHFNIEQVQLTHDQISEAAVRIRQFASEKDVDTEALQKKIRYRKKIPVRKLYIADLHFFHDSQNHRMDMRGFSDYEEMNAHMIRQWNDHVTRKDEVYILGDFAISWVQAAESVLRQLNGRKFLIQGNHDKFLEDKKFDRSLFEWIRPYAEIQDAGRKVILSHYPVFCYNGQYRLTPEGQPIAYMLYGHVHNTHDERLVNEFIRITKGTMVTSRRQPQEHPIPCNMINCFCMFSDYIPLTLDDWIRVDEKRREKVFSDYDR